MIVKEDTQNKLPGELVASMSALNEMIISPLSDKPDEAELSPLRTVPTIVIAHTFLRISRHSDFLSPMLTNTGIFLRGLKLSGESRS